MRILSGKYKGAGQAKNFTHGARISHGNFMRPGPIAAGEQDGSQAVSQRVFSAMRRWSRQYEECQDDVWPEVASNYSLDEPAKPENSPRRVLSEAILVLALAGLVAVAASFLVPALS
jgi:hypothetical protein